MVGMLACTHYSGHEATPPHQTEVGEPGEYVVVEFPPGKDRLLESEKQKIRELQRAAEGRNDVQAIKVLAWSDQEYPVQGSAQPSAAEQKLAEDRGRAIRDFLKKDLGSQKDIDTHNMARQPGVFAQVFASEEMGIVSENKDSKAVIVITYE